MEYRGSATPHLTLQGYTFSALHPAGRPEIRFRACSLPPDGGELALRALFLGECHLNYACSLGLSVRPLVRDWRAAQASMAALCHRDIIAVWRGRVEPRKPDVVVHVSACYG